MDILEYLEKHLTKFFAEHPTLSDEDKVKLVMHESLHWRKERELGIS